MWFNFQEKSFIVVTAATQPSIEKPCSVNTWTTFAQAVSQRLSFKSPPPEVTMNKRATC